MIATLNFIVEIDLYRNEGGRDGGLFVAKEGTDFQTKPKDGILAATLEGSGVPNGCTVYFHHFAIDTAFRYKDKIYVTVQPDELYGYMENGELKGFSRVVGERVLSEDFLNNETAKIKKLWLDVEKYDELCFKTVHNPTDLPIDEGDIISIYKDTDYILHGMEQYSFLDPDKVVYNITKDDLLPPWVMVEHYANKKDFVSNGTLFIQENKLQNKRSVVVKKSSNPAITSGDKMIAKRPKSSITQHRDLSVIPFHNILAYDE